MYMIAFTTVNPEHSRKTFTSTFWHQVRDSNQRAYLSALSVPVKMWDPFQVLSLSDE